MRSSSTAPAVSKASAEFNEESDQALSSAEGQLHRFQEVSEALERDAHQLRALSEQVPTAATIQRLPGTQGEATLVIQWDARQSAQLDAFVSQERVKGDADWAGWQRVARDLSASLGLADQVEPTLLAEACRSRYLALETYRKQADWADEQLTTVLLGLDAIPGVSRHALLVAHQERRTAQAKRISALIGRRKKLIERCLALEMELEQQRARLGLGTGTHALVQENSSSVGTSEAGMGTQQDESLS
jgi:hypothetical protein